MADRKKVMDDLIEAMSSGEVIKINQGTIGDPLEADVDRRMKQFQADLEQQWQHTVVLIAVVLGISLLACVGVLLIGVAGA